MNRPVEPRDLRRIMCVNLQVRKATSKRTPVSVSLQKSTLMLIATHEGEPMPIHFVAAMLGVSRTQAGCALVVLQDQGLIFRHDAERPFGWRGPCFGYRVEWVILYSLELASMIRGRSHRTKSARRARVAA